MQDEDVRQQDSDQRSNDKIISQSQEGKYRILLESLGDAILLGTTEDTFIDCNQAACKLYGYSKEQLLHMTWHDLIEALPANYEVQDHPFIEAMGRRGDGTTFPIEVNIHQITLEGEQKILTHIRDATECQSTNATLQESQHTLITFMHNFPGMAYRCQNDSYWTMEFVSEGCLTLTGYEPRDLIQNAQVAYATLIHPDDVTHVWDTIQTAVKEKETYTAIYRLFTKTQEVKWVWEQGQGIYTATGEIIALEGIILDITNQRKLEEQRHLLEKAFAAADFSITITDASNNIIWVNPAFTKLTGYTAEEVTGAPMTLIRSGYHPEAFYDQMWVTLKAGNVWQGELTNCRKDGTHYQEALTITPVCNNNGKITHFISIKQDITKRKQLEAQQEAYQERLKKQHRTLIQLSIPPLVGEIRLELALQRIIEATAEVLDAARAHIWQLKQEDAMLCCLASYKESADRPMIGETIPISQCPYYFETPEDELVIAINNVAQDPRTSRFTPDGWGAHKPVAILSAPIRVHGKTIGILNYEHDGMPRDWEADEVTFANQAADLIARTFLDADLRRHAEELAVITKVSREITSVPDLKKALTSIATHAATFSNADTCSVFTFNAADKITITGYGLSNAFLSTIENTDLPLDPTYFTQEVRRPLQIPDLTQIPTLRHTKLVEIESLHSVLVAPMYHDMELIGGIILGHRQPRYFSEQEISFLEALAQQTVNAIENTKLFESLAQEKGRLELLYSLEQHIAESLDVQDVAQRALQELCKALKAPGGSILLFDAEQKTVQPTAVVGLEMTNVEQTCAHLSLPYQDSGAAIWRNVHRQSLIVDDLGDAPTCTFLAGVGGTMCSVLSVPLLNREELVGMLCLYSAQPAFFKEEHLQFVESAAATIALAIANALLFKETQRLFQAEQEKRELAEALGEAAAFVSSNLELNKVLDCILEQVARVVSGDTFNIMLVKADNAQIVRWRGYESLHVDESLPVQEIPLLRYPSLAKMKETAAPIVIADTLKDPNWVVGTRKEWRRSYVGAPINIGDQTLGFLNVNSIQPNQFGLEDSHRLKIFADHIATAIDNARLYEAQRDYAEQLEVRVQERTAELQAQYAQLEAVLQSTIDGIIVTNAAGIILQSNPIAQTWFNHSLSPEDADKLRQAIHEIAPRAKDHPEIILEFQGLDLQLNAAPIITNVDIEDADVVIAVHDISHIKALERMQSRFVSDVSHELRTPITTAKLYTQLLRCSPSEKHTAYFNALEEELDRQAKLIEDILDLSRIDAGRLNLDPQPTNLNIAVESTLANHQILIQRNQLSLMCDLVLPAPLVLVDPGKLEQILNNLLGNAIHYTPARGEINVETQRIQTQGRQWALFAIKDTGIGIPEEELPHIFNRFFRGSEPREKQLQGTGLGLAIVKEIVELHGGRIEVKSKVKEGSTFTVWLPLIN